MSPHRVTVFKFVGSLIHSLNCWLLVANCCKLLVGYLLVHAAFTKNLIVLFSLKKKMYVIQLLKQQMQFD